MGTKQTKQIAYFQWLRVFAAAAVVVMHTEGSWWPSVSHETKGWQVLTAYDGLVRWPVPVFLMISGAIFLPRKTALKTVLTHYIPRMLLAYVLWSGIYALYGAYRGASGEDTLMAFVSGHYHLWYLPFLCGVYLTLPFVQKIAEDARLTRQLLAVGCVIGLLVPWLADAAVLLRPGAGGIVRTLEAKANFSFFFDHLSILVLGHVLHQTELSPGARRLLYAAGILSAALTAPATVWATRLARQQNTLFCDIASPTTLCAAAALFIFAKHHLNKLPKIVEWMASCSFGIYLVHVLVLEVLEGRGIHALAWDPVWAVPVLSAAVFAISLAVSAVLRRLPAVGKYLV